MNGVLNIFAKEKKKNTQNIPHTHTNLQEVNTLEIQNTLRKLNTLDFQTTTDFKKTLHKLKNLEIEKTRESQKTPYVWSVCLSELQENCEFLCECKDMDSLQNIVLDNEDASLKVVWCKKKQLQTFVFYNRDTRDSLHATNQHPKSKIGLSCLDTVVLRLGELVLCLKTNEDDVRYD